MHDQIGDVPNSGIACRLSAVSMPSAMPRQLVTFTPALRGAFRKAIFAINLDLMAGEIKRRAMNGLRLAGANVGDKRNHARHLLAAKWKDMTVAKSMPNRAARDKPRRACWP